MFAAPRDCSLQFIGAAPEEPVGVHPLQPTAPIRYHFDTLFTIEPSPATEHRSTAPMRLLFVHERFGALGGAEANVLLTATELKRRGHIVGLLHGAPTGREEPAWS